MVVRVDGETLDEPSAAGPAGHCVADDPPVPLGDAPTISGRGVGRLCQSLSVEAPEGVESRSVQFEDGSHVFPAGRSDPKSRLGGWGLHRPSEAYFEESEDLADPVARIEEGGLLRGAESGSQYRVESPCGQQARRLDDCLLVYVRPAG